MRGGSLSQQPCRQSQVIVRHLAERRTSTAASQQLQRRLHRRLPTFRDTPQRLQRLPRGRLRVAARARPHRRLPTIHVTNQDMLKSEQEIQRINALIVM